MSAAVVSIAESTTKAKQVNVLTCNANLDE